MIEPSKGKHVSYNHIINNWINYHILQNCMPFRCYLFEVQPINDRMLLMWTYLSLWYDHIINHITDMIMAVSVVAPGATLMFEWHFIVSGLLIWFWWFLSGGASGATQMFKCHIIISCFHWLIWLWQYLRLIWLLKSLWWCLKCQNVISLDLALLMWWMQMIWQCWYDYSSPSGGASGATQMLKWHIIVACSCWCVRMLRGKCHIAPSYPKFRRRRRTLQGAIDLTAPPQVKRRDRALMEKIACRITRISLHHKKWEFLHLKT